MKYILLFLIISLSILSSTGYSSVPDKISPLDSVKTYKDIPNVSEEEISAIEALKSNRDKFSYGTTISTESFILPDGSHAGFTQKLCELLSELFGISFVQEIYEWDELMNKLESRSLDFTGELTPTEKRSRIYSMTLPIAERSLRIFMRADSDKIQTEADINGCKVGFLEGSATADSIKTVYPILFHRINVENYHTAARMIENGEIDAFIDDAVADPVFDEYDFIRSIISFPVVYESVAITTANSDLAPVTSVINKYIAAGGVDRLYALYKDGEFEYAKYKLNRSYTDEERAYIDELNQRGAPIYVATTHDNYPINFYNENEQKFQGIALDMMAEISRLTGMQFVNTEEQVWPEIFEKAKDGGVHMFAELLQSEPRKEHFIWASTPYSRSFYAIISKADYPPLATYQIVRSTVGVLKASAYEDIYNKIFPNNNNLREYDTLEDCLNALERDEVELVMGSHHMLLTQTNYREKSGFKINIKLNATMDSYFGFHKDQKVLASIINKAQQYVDTEAIVVSWTGRVFDYGKKFAEQRMLLLRIFVGVLSLMLIATVFLLVRNVTLSKKLKKIANTDGLTQVFNRRYFMELSAIQIERALRIGSSCFVVIFDLDHFKAINDTYGHAAGDKALKETAQRIKKALRPYDLLGRYGGEEFIILVSDVDATQAVSIVERIRLDVCQTPVTFEDKKIPVAASFGIAQAAPINDINMATKYADEALYKAKKEGRNRVCFFTETAHADNN